MANFSQSNSYLNLSLLSINCKREKYGILIKDKNTTPKMLFPQEGVVKAHFNKGENVTKEKINFLQMIMLW